MSHEKPLRKPTNLTLDKTLLAEARALKITLSRAAEAGLRQEIANAKSDLWKAENSSALESSNQWVETHGLPLDRYRRF